MDHVREFCEKVRSETYLCGCRRTKKAGRMVSYSFIVLGILIAGPGILMASSGNTGNLNPTYVGIGFLSFGVLIFLIGTMLCCAHEWNKRSPAKPPEIQLQEQQQQSAMCVVTEDQDAFEDYVQRRGLPHSESVPVEPLSSAEQGIVRCYVLPTSVSWPNTSRISSSGPVVYYVGRPLINSSSSSNT